MLTLQPKFDLHYDVVCDILKKEALVCRVTGEAFRGFLFPQLDAVAGRIEFENLGS